MTQDQKASVTQSVQVIHPKHVVVIGEMPSMKLVIDELHIIIVYNLAFQINLICFTGVFHEITFHCLSLIYIHINIHHDIHEPLIDLFL